MKQHDLISALISEELDDQTREQFFDELVSQPITAELLVDGVRALRKKMVPVSLSEDAIDTCGTGGCGKKTINTSSLTAFLVAACGGKVAKHGNRSASGNCGCFDLLEELDVKTDLKPKQEQQVFGELGIAFLFAPLHHPALRFVAPLRKKYGKKTVFNLLGPLCNPASVQHQIIGTGNQDDAKLIAESLRQLGSRRSIVVSGHDGLDEVSACAPTTIRIVENNDVEESFFFLEDLGLQPVKHEEIEGGSPSENAEIFLNIVKCKGTEAHRNLVLVNTACALTVAGLAETFKDGYAIAKETLSSGKVFELFEKYRDHSHSL